jgi:hypothetical protein
MNLTQAKLRLVGLLLIFKHERIEEIRTFVSENLQFLIEIFIRKIRNLGIWRRERKKQSLRVIGPDCAEKHTSVRSEADSRDLEGSEDFIGDSRRSERANN